MRLNLQPILTGNLTELRPLVKADFEPLYEAASDPLIWEQHPANDRYKKDVFEKFFLEAIKSNGAFAIVDLKSEKIIGSSRYYEYDETKQEVVIGFTFLVRDYWGGTYNREIKDLMLRHAFKCVRTVLFHVGEKNIRSQKALEKIGAIKTGDFSKVDTSGRSLKSLVYELPPEKWRPA